MKGRNYLAIVLALFFLVLGESAEAQRNKYKRQRSKNKTISRYRGRVSAGRFRPYYYVGGSINALNYFGDLAPVNKAASTDISFTRPGLGIYGGYKFHHSMAVRASFNYGRITGDDFTSDPSSEADLPRYSRNLSFRNDIKELSVGLEVYLFPNYSGPSSRPPFNGYLHTGISLIHHEPKALVPEADYQSALDGSVPAPQAGEWVKLRPLETEGVKYSPIAIAIPVTLGGTFYVNNNVSVGLEFGVRKLFTDYIDDVSSNYKGLDTFSDPLARILSDRSVEPTAVISGDSRTLGPVVSQDFNGTSYNIDSFIGSGLEGTVRGNSDNNDLIFVTQIKVTYLLPPKTAGNRRGRAKSR